MNLHLTFHSTCKHISRVTTHKNNDVGVVRSEICRANWSHQVRIESCLMTVLSLSNVIGKSYAPSLKKTFWQRRCHKIPGQRGGSKLLSQIFRVIFGNVYICFVRCTSRQNISWDGRRCAIHWLRARVRASECLSWWLYHFSLPAELWLEKIREADLDRNHQQR